MGDKEIGDLERLNGFLPIRNGLEKEHAALLASVKGAVVKLELQVALVKKEVEKIPVYPASDFRCAEAKSLKVAAIAKLRLATLAAEKAQAELSKFPSSLSFLQLDVDDGDVPQLSELENVLDKIENSLRSGSGVFIMSRLGHGKSDHRIHQYQYALPILITSNIQGEQTR